MCGYRVLAVRATEWDYRCTVGIAPGEVGQQPSQENLTATEPGIDRFGLVERRETRSNERNEMRAVVASVAIQPPAPIQPTQWSAEGRVSAPVHSLSMLFNTGILRSVYEDLSRI